MFSGCAPLPLTVPKTGPRRDGSEQRPPQKKRDTFVPRFPERGPLRGFQINHEKVCDQVRVVPFE